jgi:uncharacterized cupredoxin-like copper-binding protein
MKLSTSLAILLALLPAAALAAGSGDHSHDELAIGAAGQAGQVKRTITIEMLETDDGKMLFKPASFSVKEGETLRLRFINKGETDHEFVMDTLDAILEHKELMAKFPEMEHDDPNSIRLAPGKNGQILWKFTKSGEFAFGCLIPGHHEAGMEGDITVAKTTK